MPEKKVRALGEFAKRVHEIRRGWSVEDHKELWFRGEDKKRPTTLQPKLYRPKEGKDRKSIETLLKIENDLFAEFQRCGVQLYDKTPEEHDWDWDWYFLMQHRGAPHALA